MAISYATTPYHTKEVYADLAKSYADFGADSICIKDGKVEKDELNKLAVNVKENVLNQLGKGSLDILNEGLNDVNGYIEARLEQVLVDIKKEQ